MRFVNGVCFATLLFVTLAIAQTEKGTETAKPTYKPGQTITLSITFEGPDASKIASAIWTANVATVSPSQPNFSADMFANISKAGSAPNSFEVSFTIPANQASGQYSLNQIRASIGNPAVTLYYAATDFPKRTFTVDNPQTLIKPTIKDVKELPSH